MKQITLEEAKIALRNNLVTKKITLRKTSLTERWTIVHHKPDGTFDRGEDLIAKLATWGLEISENELNTILDEVVIL